MGVTTRRRVPRDPFTTCAMAETPPIETLVVAEVSNGGCGDAPIGSPPMIRRELLPFVVAVVPHDRAKRI